MKQVIFVSIILLVISGCGKEKCGSAACIIDEWKLVEELIDPGNGSGTFQPVSSNKKITFFSNGNYDSNGVTCTMENQAGPSSEGTFSSANGTLSPESCPNMGIFYTLSTDTLILTYHCFEGCQQKYYRN